MIQRSERSVFVDPPGSGTIRERPRGLFDNLLLHFRPLTVQERTLRFTFTWGLGGMGLVLTLLLAFTGILLMLVYKPHPDGAYTSIKTLAKDVLFGAFVRAIHYWSAFLLTVVAFLHMLRVFFTGAFTGPRAINWIIGLGLFGLVIAANLTGCFLPWDQQAFWAATISTGMAGYIPLAGPWLQQLLRGGAEMDAAALLNFYIFHTTFLPIALFTLLPFHFWRVRKAGGLVVPKPLGEDLEGKGSLVTTLPHLVTREGVTAAVLIATVFLLAAFFSAPLGAPANPGMTPNPAKAPWYFLGLQELLMHVHPLFAVFVIPATMTAALVFLPYVGLCADTAGVYFVSAKGRRIVRHSTAAALAGTPLLIAVSETLKGGSGETLSSTVSGGLVPFAVLSACLCGWYLAMRNKGDASRNEAVQGVFALLVVVLVVLTVIGGWFRGEGMALSLPWQ